MFKRNLFFLGFLIVGFGAGAPVGADVIHIQEGSYEGIILEETESEIRLDMGRRIQTFYLPEIESIERGPVPENGMRRFPFELNRSYAFYGSASYTLTFHWKQSATEDWGPWIQGFFNFYNDTETSIYTSTSVALFDVNDQLLAASSMPIFREILTDPGSSQTVNLDFPLAEYSPKRVAYFLVTFKESEEPLLGKAVPVPKPSVEAEQPVRNATRAETKALEEALRAYWTAWREGDVDGIRQRLAKSVRARDGWDAMTPAEEYALKGFGVISAPNDFEVLHASISGDWAVLEVEGTSLMGSSSGTVEFIHEEGDWKFLHEDIPLPSTVQTFE